MTSVIPVKNLAWIELAAAVAWWYDRELLPSFPLLTWFQQNRGFYSTRVYTEHRCVILISHISNTLGLLVPRVPHNCSCQRWYHQIHKHVCVLFRKIFIRTCIWHAFLSQLDSSLSLVIYDCNLCRCVQVHSINLHWTAHATLRFCLSSSLRNGSGSPTSPSKVIASACSVNLSLRLKLSR